MLWTITWEDEYGHKHTYHSNEIDEAYKIARKPIKQNPLQLVWIYETHGIGQICVSEGHFND